MTKTIKTTAGLLATALAGILSSPTALADDARLAAGEKLFKFRCAACHTLDATDIPTAASGPHLEGIVGRLAGSVKDYEYEFDLMREQAFVWDVERLEAWLEKPQEMVPGMCMPYFGLRRENDRAALMTYLQSAP